jgi:hypothetical protein
VNQSPLVIVKHQSRGDFHRYTNLDKGDQEAQYLGSTPPAAFLYADLNLGAFAEGLGNALAARFQLLDVDFDTFANGGDYLAFGFSGSGAPWQIRRIGAVAALGLLNNDYVPHSKHESNTGTGIAAAPGLVLLTVRKTLAR